MSATCSPALCLMVWSFSIHTWLVACMHMSFTAHTHSMHRAPVTQRYSYHSASANFIYKNKINQKRMARGREPTEIIHLKTDSLYRLVRDQPITPASLKNPHWPNSCLDFSILFLYSDWWTLNSYYLNFHCEVVNNKMSVRNPTCLVHRGH